MALAAAAGTLLTLLVVLLVVRSHGTAPENSDALTTPIDAPFGASLPSTKAGQAWTFGGMAFCLKIAGQAQIDSVTLTNPQGGIRISGFAVRPLTNNMFGAEPTSLKGSGFNGTNTVTSTCNEAPHGDELAIEVSKDRAADARADGFTVHWHDAGGNGQIQVPFHVVLCQGPDETVSSCKAFPHDA